MLRKLRHWKMTPDAGGVVRAIIGQYCRAGDAKALLERSDKLLNASELCGGWSGLVEIADQTNTDAIIGHPRSGGLSRLLAVPSLADLDLSVAAAVAVADQEMVAKSVVPTEGEGVSAPGSAVMDINILPTIPFHRSRGFEDRIESFSGVGHHKARHVRRKRGRRQRQKENAGQRYRAEQAGENQDVALGHSSSR